MPPSKATALRLAGIAIWFTTASFAWLLFKGVHYVWHGFIVLIPILLLCWMRLSIFIVFRLVERRHAND